MPLTPEQREHFAEHGWLRIENSMDPEIMDKWLADVWVRLGFDPNDKSTWVDDKGEVVEFLKMPRHREVLASELCPKAWEAMVEIAGGDQNIDPVRERYHGDQFIINFGSEESSKLPDPRPQDLTGWHHDNDWYRQFLDSSGNAMTIIHCFTDIPEGGGGTMLCEDGLGPMCKIFLDNPQGFDPPFTKGEGGPDLYAAVKKCEKFAQIVAKKGDTFITHGLLPHAVTLNHLHYARIITNPHVNMCVPWNFNRPDGNYTLLEQVILRALGRESIPEWKPTRERKTYYPRTATFKVARADGELQRMLADAAKTGKPVDSVYLQGEEALAVHRQRNGYDKPHNPDVPVAYTPQLSGESYKYNKSVAKIMGETGIGPMIPAEPAVSAPVPPV